jgi:phospholipid-binding lipoprotein MlaA
MSPRHFALTLMLALSLGACAQAPGTTATPGDPIEPWNRDVLDANMAVDRAVIRPVAEGYRAAVPGYARTRIRNFVNNLNEPRILVNNLLQGRLADAGSTFARFTFNSVFGLGGLWDVSTGWGLPQRTGDFGQTLHAWGAEDGAYLMWPIAGPSNVRDTVGWVADGFLNPLNWVIPTPYLMGRGAVQGVDLREQTIEGLDELQRGSLDFYARLRSVWQQRRNAELGRSSADALAPAPGVADTAAPIDVLADPGAANKIEAAAPLVLSQPRISSALRRRSSATRRSAPPCCRRVANSARRDASSLMVPVR